LVRLGIGLTGNMGWGEDQFAPWGTRIAVSVAPAWSDTPKLLIMFQKKGKQPSQRNEISSPLGRLGRSNAAL